MENWKIFSNSKIMIGKYLIAALNTGLLVHCNHISGMKMRKII